MLHRGATVISGGSRSARFYWVSCTFEQAGGEGDRRTDRAMALILFIYLSTLNASVPGFIPGGRGSTASVVQRRPTRCNHIVNGTAYQSARACRAQTSSSRILKRDAPLFLAIGTEALRSEGKAHTFESCRARQTPPNLRFSAIRHVRPRGKKFVIVEERWLQKSDAKPSL